MENNKVSYIKSDNNVLINETCIRWVEKINNCLEVCTKSLGCTSRYDTHRICESSNPNSYAKINKHFE